MYNERKRFRIKMYFILSKKNTILLFQKKNHNKYFNKVAKHKLFFQINLNLNNKKNKKMFLLIVKLLYKNKKDNY